MGGPVYFNFQAARALDLTLGGMLQMVRHLKEDEEKPVFVLFNVHKGRVVYADVSLTYEEGRETFPLKGLHSALKLGGYVGNWEISTNSFGADLLLIPR